MGWLTRMIGIPTFGAAQNALLVEAMLPQFDDKDRAAVKDEMVISYWKAGGGNRSMAAVVERLSAEPRIVQLNLIAMALNNMGVAPPFKGEFWAHIKNPFLHNLATDNEVWSVVQRLKAAHHVELSIGSEQIEFSTW